MCRCRSLASLSFNVHGVLYIEDEGHIAPVEKEIRSLSSALQAVKDEQEYIVVRERVHRNSESPAWLSAHTHTGSRGHGADRLCALRISGGIHQLPRQMVVDRSDPDARWGVRLERQVFEELV